MNQPWLQIVYCLLLAFLSSSCHTQKNIIDQEQLPKRSYHIEGSFTSFEMDHLGNTYTVSKDNVLRRYNSDYKMEFEYSINRLGELSHIDVSNPQKLLLYYSDYQHIVFLDNTLSEIKNLNLEPLGYWDVQGIAISRENNIWLYDPVNNRLLKLRDSGDLILSSNEQWFEAFQYIEDPRLFENEERLYLYTSDQVFLFDNFGNMQGRKLVSCEQIQFLKNRFLYLNADKIYSEAIREELVELNEPLIKKKNLIDFHFLDGYFYMLDSYGIWREKY